MRHKILIVGAGDAGRRIAEILLQRERVRELTLMDLPGGVSEKYAAKLAGCFPISINFAGISALDRKALESLLRRVQPDVIVQTGSLRSPWAIIGVDHPIAHALEEAGMAVQFAYQFPILHTLMQAVHEVNCKAPVANISFPDLAHHILDLNGIAPAAGLGNISNIQMLTRTNLWRKLKSESSGRVSELPKIRALGGHSQAYEVMHGERPDDPDLEPLIYLGAEGRPANEIAYIGPRIEATVSSNLSVACAAIPTIEALLPNAAPLDISMPGPLGLIGGYPVRIQNQSISLDLPSCITIDEAEAYNRRILRRDGVDRVDDGGVIHYTDEAKQALAAIEPALTEPFDPMSDTERLRILLRVIDQIA